MFEFDCAGRGVMGVDDEDLICRRFECCWLLEVLQSLLNPNHGCLSYGCGNKSTPMEDVKFWRK